MSSVNEKKTIIFFKSAKSALKDFFFKHAVIYAIYGRN